MLQEHVGYGGNLERRVGHAPILEPSRRDSAPHRTTRARRSLPHRDGRQAAIGQDWPHDPLTAGRSEGYRHQQAEEGRSLWSREPWEEVDDYGGRLIASRKFVAGVTRTTLGMVTVIGICIPFHGARIALSEDLSARSLGLIDRFRKDRQLSDHHGIDAELSAQG